MESIIYGKPIQNSVNTLKLLISNFATYAKEQKFSDEDTAQYEETLQAIDLIRNSISQIEIAKNNLQELVDRLKNDYDNTKSKEDRKNMLQQMENIEKETNFTEISREATEMIFMLDTRLTEAVSNEKRLARKLGLTHNASHEVHQGHDNRMQGDNTPRETMQTSMAVTSIPPPRINMPKFYGNEEEFPEFWAAYETLVHKNPSLSVIEKMLLLKESLRGKSDRSIKGIQLLPQNYEWMIDTLKRKYGNRPTNRARIVQELTHLAPASNSPQSNEYVYDKIATLLNQMISAGQDIRSTNDAMWIETILQKFPQAIVEPVLIKMREQEDVTVGCMMDMLEAEISAKSYVQSRGTLRQEKRKSPPQVTQKITDTTSQNCVICGKSGHYPWQCRSTVSVTDRRKIMLEKRLCWKCYSNQHTSPECNRENCPLCGKLHHIKLCFLNRNMQTGSNVGTIPRYDSTKGQYQNTDEIVQNDTYQKVKVAHGSGKLEIHPKQGKNRFINTHFAKNNANKNVGLINTNDENSTASHMSIAAKPLQEKLEEQIVLMTAAGSIWNHNSEKFEKAIFFFDTGAQKTLIQEHFAYKLGLPKLKSETCIMSGIGGVSETFASSIVSLRVGTAYGKDFEILVQTKPILTNGFPAVKLSLTDQQFLQENNILVCNPSIRGEIQVPHILVGLDYYYSFILENGDPLYTPSGLRMAKTVFGPTVYGRGNMDAREATNLSLSTPMIVYNMNVVDESEKEMLNKLFELEGLGISADEADDKNFMEYLESYSKQISFKDGFVTAPFPLKPNIQDLADNYSVALRRLLSLHRQLESNPLQKDWYCKILTQYESDDVIEKVTEDIHDSVGLYYMPHSGVWRPHKPRPLRIVFDASSKRKGQLSLNDVMQKGASLINKIHDILIASRTSRIIMLCDIEAAFTQIRLRDTHKDLCRFLWLKNPNAPPTRDNIIEYRFKRVPFGAKPSPSILNMSIIAFLQTKTTSLAQEILNNLYVDNILLACDTLEEALEKYKESKALFAEIGMNLREYVSNDEKVNALIPEKDRAPSGIIKFLGVTYNTSTDEFQLSLEFAQKNNLTKKDIVSQLNSIYDPIGMAAPILIHFKNLFREVCNTGLDWKDTVPKNLAIEWQRLCQQANKTTLSLSRFVNGWHPGDIISLWVFADASEKALATCAFIRYVTRSFATRLISGKTRLAPKNTKQTIPRLEILAILMAVRLAKTIISATSKKISEVNIISDSEIALSWLKSERDLPRFVENQKFRIDKILSVFKAAEVQTNFFHVPSEYNPADAGTRGVEAQKMTDLPWLQGPLWLNEEKTPRCLKLIDYHTTVEKEDNNSAENCDKLQLSLNHAKIMDLGLIQLSRFSRLSNAVRTIARVGKVIHHWANRVNMKTESACRITLNYISSFAPDQNITANDTFLSEKIILREAHRYISVNELQKRFPQKKLFRDEDGIIRNESRLQNASISYDTRNPIYIEKESDLARLILTDIHFRNAHSGKEHTLCIARQRFWISRPSSAFNKYVKNCVICKKTQGLPFGAPEMPPLPKDRVMTTKPFENVGCDFMGPFYSSNNEKMYICLYTCLTTRAVHLEVVEDLSAGAFLNSFIRYISRRGVPKLIRTDCGTNFKLGQHIISTMFEEDQETGDSLMSYSATHGIQWIFNPPGAPWMGGAWERLVGTVKRALAKSIGRKKLSFTQFCTIAARIEAIINTRPLTSIRACNIDSVPIRPVDFLEKSLRYALPPKSREEIQDPSFDPSLIQSTTQAKQALEFAEIISEKFWERWRVEYLTALRDIQVKNRKQPRHAKLREPTVGEIVLVEQENLPRGSWCYGKVLELIKSNDSLVRSVKLLMPNKHVWHRPLNKIYPLEIPCSPKDSPTQDVSSERPETSTEKGSFETTYPPRKAKIKAQEALKSMHSKQVINVNLFSTCLYLALVASATALPNIACKSGKLSVIPPRTKFELCFKATCKTFPLLPEELLLTLPMTSKQNKATVSLRYFEKNILREINRTCELPHICEAAQSILSKNLIGNPYCWPTGVLISVGIVIYFVASIFMAIAWCIIRLCKVQATTHKSHRRMEKTTTESPRNNTENVQLRHFHLTPIGRASALAITIVIILNLLSEKASACQHTHSRFNTEMICTSKNKCFLEFNREILFNDVENSVCLNILHANQTIGNIHIERLALELKCSKRTIFFTRETKHQIYSVKRCAQMGSCIDNICTEMNESTHIPEFGNAYQYPGYSGCEPSCGGFLCGCLLPLPACSFYRIAHLPQSELVYEIARCIEWTPTVQVKIRITLYNTHTERVLKLVPYIPTEIDTISFTVISVTKPTSPILSSKFAISKLDTLVIPDNYNIPVECATTEDATSHFQDCKNKMICTCDVEAPPARCYCPNHSLANLKAHQTNIFPISTPYFTITNKKGIVTVSSKKGEMTISVQSKALQHTAQYVLEQECKIHFARLTGCYNCQEAATLITYCRTEEPAWVIIQCEDHSFPIQCNSTVAETKITLAFQEAVVDKTCQAKCNGRFLSMPLQGVLAYLPHLSDGEILESHANPWAADNNWFHNWTVPDLNPLILTIKDHWKTALAVLGAAAVMTAATYYGGPTVIIMTMQLLIQCIKLLLHIIVFIIKLLIAAIKMTLTFVRKTSQLENIHTDDKRKKKKTISKQ